MPVAVAEEGHLIPPGGLLFGQEGAAESGAHAEQREEAGRAQRHVDHLGPVGARAVEDRGDIGRQALERTAALAKVVEVPCGEAAAHHLELGVLALEEHEARGVAIGERLELQGVHHAEDHGARPDSQSQRKDGGGGEARAEEKRPRGETEVIHDARDVLRRPRSMARSPETLSPISSSLVNHIEIHMFLC